MENMELWRESEEYWEGLGLRDCGQYEWENDIWHIEYGSTESRPDCWEIDNFKSGMGHIMFFDIKTKSELEWLLKSIRYTDMQSS